MHPGCYDLLPSTCSPSTSTLGLRNHLACRNPDLQQPSLGAKLLNPKPPWPCHQATQFDIGHNKQEGTTHHRTHTTGHAPQDTHHRTHTTGQNIEQNRTPHTTGHTPQNSTQNRTKHKDTCMTQTPKDTPLNVTQNTTNNTTGHNARQDTHHRTHTTEQDRTSAPNKTQYT